MVELSAPVTDSPTTDVPFFPTDSEMQHDSKCKTMPVAQLQERSVEYVKGQEGRGGRRLEQMYTYPVNYSFFVRSPKS